MFPICIRSTGSILYSQTKVEDIPNICDKYGFTSAPLADINSLSQCVHYHKAMTEAGKKPVLGATFLSPNNVPLIVFARNKTGWQHILKLHCEASKHNDKVLINQLCSDDIIIFANSVESIDTKYLYKYRSINSKDCAGLPLTNNCYEKSSRNANNVIRCLEKNIKLNEYDYENKDDFIYSLQDLTHRGITKDEVSQIEKIFDSVETFDILEDTKLPKMADNEYQRFRSICLKNLPDDPVYKERLDYELNMINNADMCGYFLIVHDIIDYIRSKGYFLGTGRGSVGGSLAAYLSGITNVDPIKYDLIFERFYTPDRKSLPDIDIDLQPECRDELVKYLKGRYGEYSFAQVITFNRMKGAGALKSVLRTSPKNVSFGIQNAITKSLPFEGKIADELVDQKKRFGTSSILFWALKNDNLLDRWCKMDSEGNYTGDFAEEFKLAIELDGTIISHGRHASAFALSNKPLYEKSPLVWDNSANDYILGVDMYSMEDLGIIKVDLLGLDLLSKCKYVTEIINGQKDAFSHA